MESLSDNLKGKLRAFLDAWMQERYIDKEVQITSSQIVFRRPTKTLNLDPNVLLNFHDPNEKKTLLEKCKEDLSRLGVDIIDYPNYRFKEENKRLRSIIKKLSKANFRSREQAEKLETYFYLGEALASREWRQSDKKMLQERFGERA